MRRYGVGELSDAKGAQRQACKRTYDVVLEYHLYVVRRLHDGEYIRPIQV
jgi:hypothetical protein